jgi:hypothetical protein
LGPLDHYKDPATRLSPSAEVSKRLRLAWKEVTFAQRAVDAVEGGAYLTMTPPLQWRQQQQRQQQAGLEEDDLWWLWAIVLGLRSKEEPSGLSVNGTTLVLIGLASLGTGWHLDWSEALNIAFLLVGVKVRSGGGSVTATQGDSCGGAAAHQAATSSPAPERVPRL